MSCLESIRYSDGKLEILDQLLLPFETSYVAINGTEDGWRAIKSMQIRGAPAIGVLGSLSLVVELQGSEFSSLEELQQFLVEKLDYLVSARPTAVNMLDCSRKLKALMTVLGKDKSNTVSSIKKTLINTIEGYLEEDVSTNKRMAAYGTVDIIQSCGSSDLKVLTICNTGSLATAGYGTALGVVRALHSQGRLKHCYCLETRPYNQGARLTAYELVHDKIPSTLICDSMVASLMQSQEINAVLVGADRVVANGDAANKIGTYQLAIIAKHHGVPFYVVAPSTSVDLTMKSGAEIVIEERPHEEMTSIKGVRIAAPGINVWNPAFDVTPAELITGGIVTEFGVFHPSELEERLPACLMGRSKTPTIS